jgi:gluconokinase
MPTGTSYVIMGPAGAGKSAIGTALARALQLTFVEGDAFHSPSNVARMAAGIPLTDDDRRDWLLQLAEQLRDARQRGEGLVMSCSALRRRYRDVLRAGDPEVQFVYLHGDAPLLHERLQSRTGHYMPSSLLESQLATLEVPDDDEHAWTVDIRQSRDVIVASLLARVAPDVQHPSRDPT